MLMTLDPAEGTIVAASSYYSRLPGTLTSFLMTFDEYFTKYTFIRFIELQQSNRVRKARRDSAYVYDDTE